MSENDAPPQYAVWYFVAATFLFAAPVIVLQGSAELWVTIVTFAAGLLLMVLGGVRLGHELRGRRSRRAAGQ